MRQYDLLMFDMDGTIIDSARFHVLAYKRFFKTYNIPVQMHDTLEGLGNTIEEMFGVLGVPPEDREKLYQKLEIFYKHEVDDLIRDIPLADGTREMLETMKQRGYCLSLVTNSLHPLAQRIMQLHGLTPYFASIKGATPTESGKENRCADALRELCPSGSALYVGDAARDVEIAKDLQCDSCLAVADISWMPDPLKVAQDYQPTFVIRSMRELTHLL